MWGVPSCFDLWLHPVKPSDRVCDCNPVFGLPKTPCFFDLCHFRLNHHLVVQKYELWCLQFQALSARSIQILNSSWSNLEYSWILNLSWSNLHFVALKHLSSLALFLTGELQGSPWDSPSRRWKPWCPRRTSLRQKKHGGRWFFLWKHGGSHKWGYPEIP